MTVSYVRVCNKDNEKENDQTIRIKVDFEQLKHVQHILSKR